MKKPKSNATAATATITAALAALILTGFAGCGDDGVGTQKDSRAGNFLKRFVDIPPKHPLICDEGWAWINMASDNSYDEGYVFFEDRTFVFITKPSSSDTWEVVPDGTGTWNDETIFDMAECGYSIDAGGNVLTLRRPNSKDARFVKTDNIIINR